MADLFDPGTDLYDDGWQKLYAALQNRFIIEAPVVGIDETDEGEPALLVDAGPVRCLVPLSESGVEEADNPRLTLARMRRLVGMTEPFRVRRVDRKNGVAYLSRREALEQMAEAAWRSLEEGKVLDAVVRGKTPRGVRLEVSGIQVVMPYSEATWGWPGSARASIHIGDVIRVKVTACDPEAKKLSVSAKALIPDPWPTVPERYRVGPGHEYLGTVTGVADYGVFVNLEPGVDTLALHLPTVVPRPGQKAVVRILEIRPEKREMRSRLLRIRFERRVFAPGVSPVRAFNL